MASKDEIIDLTYKIIQGMSEILQTAKGRNSSALDPVIQTISIHLPTIQRLARNMEDQIEYYNSEHFVKSLELHLEVIKGLLYVVKQMKNTNAFVQIFKQAQTKKNLSLLLSKFQTSTDNLQIGIKFDNKMQNAVEKNIEVAKVESTRPSTSQGQAVKASRINSGLSGVLDKFQSQATIERIDEGTTSTTEEEHDVAATNNELESILKVLNTRVDAYNLSVFQSKANPAGKLSLREIYLRGYSLFYAAIPDYAGAFDMFKESKSLPESKYFLGICYTYGYGTSTDFSKAKAYLLNAWNAGTFPGAMLELGRIYEFEKNMMEAFRYYLTAAALGQARACEKLAECYERGDVVYDLEEAQHWRIKADRLNFRGGP